MASIYKRGKGWQVKWRQPDGTQAARTVPSEAAAWRLKFEVEETVSAGRRWVPRDTTPVPLLSRVISDYLTDMATKRAARTLERYGLNMDVFTRFVDREVGAGARASALSKRLLQRYYVSLATGGRHDGSRDLDTRRRMTQDILLLWEWAYDEESYGDHIPRPRRFEMPRQPGTPTSAPTWEQMDACVNAMKGWHRHVAVVLRYTGLRVGQVMKLRWSDFDLDKQLLVIRGELGKSQSEKRGRIIPVSRHLIAELAGWGVRSGWLIDSKRRRGGARERVFRAREMSRGWARAKVPESIWRRRPDHAFRKGLVTGLKRLGADPEATEYLVGHKLPGMRDVYVDPTGPELAAAVALIPAIAVARSVVKLPRRGRST